MANSSGSDSLVTLLVGPSHCVRWQTNSQKGALPSVSVNIKCLGFGGAPIWSKSLWEQVAALYKEKTTQIVLIVGDARFGNSIFGVEGGAESEDIFVDGFDSIKRDYIGVHNDRCLSKRVEQAIDAYVNVYGSAVKIIYWDAICRRISDLLHKRHIVDGAYYHPSWGAAYPGAARGKCVLPMHLLLERKYPLGELSRLFIDESNHLSYVGYLFLIDLIQGSEDVSKSFDLARERMIHDLLGPIKKVANGSQLLVAGDSVWISVLRRTLGPRGIEELKLVGVNVQATGFGNGNQNQIGNITPYDRFLFVSHEMSLNDFLLNNPSLAAGLRGSENNGIVYVPWEPIVSRILVGDKLITTRGNIESADDELLIDLFGKTFVNEDIRRLIELGHRGEPNWLGVVKILEASAPKFKDRRHHYN